MLLAMDWLEQAAQAFAQLYQQQADDSAAAPEGETPEATAGATAGADEDVIDAEFETK